MTAADAAYQVLKEKGRPMSAKELSQEILSKGLWETKGKSPDQTIGSRLYMEIKSKGDKSRFVKTGKNQFYLRENYPVVDQPDLFPNPQPSGKKPTKSILYAPAIAVLKSEKGNPLRVGQIRRLIVAQFPDLKWSKNSGPLRAMLLSAAKKNTPIKLVKDSDPPQFYFGELPTRDEPPPASPEEIIEQAMNDANNQLKAELLSKVKQMNDSVFEELVNQLIEKLGFGNHITTPRSHDHGIDGMIYGDSLGLNVIGVQSKHYTTQTVCRGDIDTFIGALEGRNGVFVTTSSFSSGAREKAEHTGSNSHIALIDGEKLVDLMIANNLGVQEHKRYTLYRIDSDYFEELEG